MKVLVILVSALSIFVFAFLIFHLATRKYVSPYTFTVVFGKKGVGKSCSMQKDLIAHHKRGWHCYADSNTDLPFVTKIDARNLHRIKFPPNSFITIDEMNLLWDNRDFKTFDKGIQSLFRQQRKLKLKIIGYSQTFDCDKKLRDLADRLAIQTKVARLWTVRRYYFKTPRVLSAETTRETSRIADDYIKVPIFFRGIDITYIPKYVRCYNTNEIKAVEDGRKTIS